MTGGKGRGFRWLPWRADLPLDRDSGARFLPWILAIMVYLASVAAGVAITMEEGARHWRSLLERQITVEFPAQADESPAERRKRLDAAVEGIAATPGIERARLLDPQEIAELLEPWLAQATRLEIPLPDLAAVTLAPGIAIDSGELRRRLTEVAPGATIDDHADFAGRALDFIGTVEKAALALLALVLLASAGLVALIATAGLSIHRRVVEILALFGADDSYIARQFQTQALRFGALGAIVGGGAAALTLHLGFIWLRQGKGIAAPSGLDTSQVLALIAVPIFFLAVAVVTARLVVMAALRRES